jgi:hypothetical protein
MSGFGIRAFKRLKEESTHIDDRRKYFSHIVVGDDFMAVWMFLKLRKEHGAEKVCLITENPLDQKTLLEEWKCSIHTLRDEETANTLIGLKPQLEITPSNTKVQFYKDTKLHEFGGRAKPMPLGAGEEEFLGSFYKVNFQNLFTSEDWEALDEVLKGQENKILQSIELSTPQDLVEKTFFKLHTGEHESFECEHLHWVKNPKKFHRLVENKEELADAISEYCTHLQTQTGVVVHFDCDREIHPEAGTVFLPQSMTHEWGHFIVDFEAFDPASNQQGITGLILLKDEDLTEEELAKKIKLLKRVMERVFPEFSKSNYTEYIRFAEDMFIHGMKDELMQSMRSAMPQLEMLGSAAPIGPVNSDNIFSVTRGLVSLLS